MRTRVLGKTRMELTVVGLGSWAIGGGGWSFGWGRQDDRESIAAIRHAVESGINWIDTAAIYGLGHSEEVVGKALQTVPEADRPFVFTKCGLYIDPADPYQRPQRIAAPARLRAEVDESLRRLRLERIDLYQVHWPPDDGTSVEEYWGTMLDLKREGKIRAAGLSNHKLAHLELAEAVGHVDSLQVPFSAIRRECAVELSWCEPHETGVIAYAPMQSGLLTGAFSVARVASLDREDWRARDPEFLGERLEHNLAVADVFADIAAERATTTAAVAVAWTLAWSGVTAAIVGARRPTQIDDWLLAAGIVLDDEELGRIAKVIEKTGAGGGPARPPR